MSIATDVIAHHLRLFGVLGVDDAGRAKISIYDAPGADLIVRIREQASAGVCVVLLRTGSDFCASFEIVCREAGLALPAILNFTPKPQSPWARLRTLHPVRLYGHPAAVRVVETAEGEAAWIWLPLGRGGLLLIGTDLAGDLVRYRQGDPAAVARRHADPVGGISNERPIYLFEAQLVREAPGERHADWWAMALATCVANSLGVASKSLLPNGACGALVITGDDDQAQLANYEAQQRLLGQTPITYFLHPLTKHTPRTLRTTLGKPWIDLGLHPDALDAPQSYADRFADQVRWFRRLTGSSPLSVRNHGFLNDGYWGHLPAWERAGVRLSSNLPGIDGRVLNGSFLPARLAIAGRLTGHWSLLTAIGDGIIFALNHTEDRAAAVVADLAQSIRDSGIPGVIVLNLHPDNVRATRALHKAALEVIAQGFLAWTMRDCLSWFEQRDGVPQATTEARASLLDRFGRWRRAGRKTAPA